MKTCDCRSILSLTLSLAVALSLVPLIMAQQEAPVVPTLIKFGGTLSDASGTPLAGVTGVTFLLYKEEQGGAPLWTEIQNVTSDKSGHYTAVLGSMSTQGLPTDLFASGKRAGWACKRKGSRNSREFCC